MSRNKFKTFLRDAATLTPTQLETLAFQFGKTTGNTHRYGRHTAAFFYAAASGIGGVLPQPKRNSHV